jgi:AdoMet-dependent rRNA methyltransferase SPB1
LRAQNSLKDITARTIGKVAEAKARKQRRLQRALTKLKKKAEGIANNSDMSERDKSQEIEKMYKKKLGGKSEKDKKKVMVGAGGGSAKRSRSDQRGLRKAAARAKGKGKKHAGNSKKHGKAQKKSKNYSRAGRK